jgi:hypothetical protein
MSPFPLELAGAPDAFATAAAELEAVGLAIASAIIPPSCLAGSSSAWPSRVRSRPGRLVFADEPTGARAHARRPRAAAPRQTTGRDNGRGDGEADRFQLGRGGSESVRGAGELERNGDIFQRAHRREQVKGLQHDPDAAAPSAGERVLAEQVEIGAGDVDGAAGRLFHAGQHRHQR